MNFENVHLYDILAQPDLKLLDSSDPELLCLLRTNPVGAIVEDKRILGYIIVSDEDNIQSLLFIEVVPELRRRGIAEKLLAHYINKDKDLYLCPSDPASSSFFQHMYEKGLIKNLFMI